MFHMVLITVPMLLLSVIVAGVVILDPVGVLVVRLGHVILVKMTVLVLPRDFAGLADHRSLEMLERVSVTVGSRVSYAPR